MCDDFYNDFDGDFDRESEDAGDATFNDEGREDIESSDEDCSVSGPEYGFSGGLEWQDWMIIGPLSEEITRERRERERMRREND